MKRLAKAARAAMLEYSGLCLLNLWAEPELVGVELDTDTYNGLVQFDREHEAVAGCTGNALDDSLAEFVS